jgi:hypothetical protein
MCIERLCDGGESERDHVHSGRRARTRLCTLVGSDVFLERDSFAEFEVAFAEKEVEVEEGTSRYLRNGRSGK